MKQAENTIFELLYTVYTLFLNLFNMILATKWNIIQFGCHTMPAIMHALLNGSHRHTSTHHTNVYRMLSLDCIECMRMVSALCALCNVIHSKPSKMCYCKDSGENLPLAKCIFSSDLHHQISTITCFDALYASANHQLFGVHFNGETLEISKGISIV